MNLNQTKIMLDTSLYSQQDSTLFRTANEFEIIEHS